jgi:hypothetical protein
MAELDDQLRQLAAHRAGSVPAFDPAAARLRAHRSARRRAAAVTGIAACVVALLVIGGFAVFAGSDDSPSVHTPPGSNGAPVTSAPTTGSSGCPTLDGADQSAKGGTSSIEDTDATLSAVRVGVQASDCVDDVDFSFDLGSPRWSLRHEASPFADDGSGSTWYVITFSGLAPTAFRDIGGQVQVHPPSGVTAVRQVPRTDGTIAWAIGMAEERPFRVVARENLLRVQFASATPRTLTCNSSDLNPTLHFAYDVPAGWFLELTSGGNTCALFSPQPFVMCSACDGPFDWGGITVTRQGPGVSAPDVLVSSTETTVAGRSATVQEVEASGQGLFPAGYRTYEYFVDWAPQGTLAFWFSGMPGPDFDVRKAGLDAIAASVRRLD